MHHMAFEFLGGDAHCGRPWHRFGAPFALRDCTDHEPNGCGAVLENVLYGEPARCHDTTGWPEFTDWPDPNSLTHEQSYYRWLERSWRSGQRIFVNLLVENRVLCEAYPIKHNSCNEMDSVLLQAQRMQELQDYIDAQSGGPGEGWFRIVRNPFRARKVINQGKLAVVMGMEVSEPFGCRLQPPNQTPACDAEDITGWLDQLHELGVRQLEIINKFDNALSGVAGDDGDVGAVVELGQLRLHGQLLGPRRQLPGRREPRPRAHDARPQRRPDHRERDRGAPSRPAAPRLSRPAAVQPARPVRPGRARHRRDHGAARWSSTPTT